MLQRLHVHISGQVQGVGFRWATRARANTLQLAGWVRNMPDGRVEAVFEGPLPALEAMLAWCRQGPFGATVREVDYTWSEAGGAFDDFQIRHR